LRQLDIADSLQEEMRLAKFYSLFVRIKKKEGKLLGEFFDTEYFDVEIKTVEDSDKFTRPYCTLVLRKKPGADSALTKKGG
jgi:hypothetical protein